MSVLAFYGFDGVATGVQGSSGDAAIAPLNGVGVTGTRNQPLTIKLYNLTAPQYNAVGVTGLDRHKVGQGGDRRNALVLHRYSYAISFSAGVTINLFENFEGRTNAPWKVVSGFTYADFADQEPTVAYWLARVSRGVNPSYTNLIQRRNDGKLSVNGNLVPVERNREYYFEIELWCETVDPTRSSNPVSCRIWLDGVVIGEWLGSFGTYVSTSSLPLGLEVGYVAHASNPVTMQMGIADVYVVDGKGEAPYNAPMGAHKVLFKKPTAVVEGRWTPDGAADPLEALRDGSDATGIKSPTGSASAVIEFDLGLTASSVISGVQVVGRGSRGPGAQRTITSVMEDSQGEQVSLPTAADFGSTLGDVNLVGYLPSKTEDLAALVGNKLSNLIVDLKVD